MPSRIDRIGCVSRTVAFIAIVSGCWLNVSLLHRATAQDATETLQDAELWSLRSLRPVSIPSTESHDWARTDIDRFVLAKLEAVGMRPSPDADAAVLFRRLYFDLIGLPPTIEEQKRLKQRLERSSLERVLDEEVDRLLESAAYGERWGRHWLDVARFGESSGKEANISFPYAWRYRDYVIDSFQQDLPYDRFIVEQIAGDLLPSENATDRARLLNATGFLAIGAKNLDEANPLQFAADVIDEQIDTVTRAIMGHSIACARCHDHKSDPYSMEDYYGLAGIFASTKTYFGTFISPSNRMGGDPLPLPRDADQPILQKSITPKRVKELKSQLAALKKEHEDGMAAVMKKAMAGEDASNTFTLRDALRIFWTSGGIEGQLEQVDEEGKALPLTMGVRDGDEIVDVPLLERGDVTQPTSKISRRLPSPIANSSHFTIPATQSGRLELAKWLASSDHPLTARVMANRIWHHLMGRGLVSTVDDFGSTGQPPSHPELLDYLATKFIDGGWSTKRLIKNIVMSRVYRQSSTFDRTNFEKDPDNQWLWRFPKRRLDAEAIRDAMLVVSGELNHERPVGSLVATKIGDRPISLIGLDTTLPSDLDGTTHRSVYLPVIRDRLPDVLAIFDFAEPSLVTGARETTNVPVQALYLMNSSFVLARAKVFAKRLNDELASEKHDHRLDWETRFIDHAFLLSYGRLPDPHEMKLGQRFLQAQANKSSSTETTQEDMAQILFCHAILASAEFRNLD